MISDYPLRVTVLRFSFILDKATDRPSRFDGYWSGYYPF
jgi:hypothetical protein